MYLFLLILHKKKIEIMAQQNLKLPLRPLIITPSSNHSKFQSLQDASSLLYHFHSLHHP